MEISARLRKFYGDSDQESLRLRLRKSFSRDLGVGVVTQRGIHHELSVF